MNMNKQMKLILTNPLLERELKRFDYDIPWCSFLGLGFIVLGSVDHQLSSNLDKYVPLPTLSWNTNYMYIRLLEVVLQLMEALFIFFSSSFPLHVSFWIASFAVCLKFIFSSTACNLLLEYPVHFSQQTLSFSSLKVLFGSS